MGFDNIYSAHSSLNFKESDLHYDAVAGIASPYEESSSGLGRGCNPVRNTANDENENAVNKRVKKTQKKRESAEVSYGDVYQQRDSSNTFGFAPNREHTF